VRNFALILAGMGPEDAEFVRVSCVGIAEVTQAVIFGETLKGKLPKVRSSRTTQRTVKNFVHSATYVSMKDGTEYVFDWWPTLNPKNPLISTYPQWLIAGTTIENRSFRGLTRVSRPPPVRSPGRSRVRRFAWGSPSPPS
jgi:hypothetical protein